MLGEAISLGFHVPDFGEDFRPIRLASTQIQRIFGSQAGENGNADPEAVQNYH
jgi:hypothetical protein